MQVATRRLIIVSAIALFGATTGVALGNFVARGPKLSGLDELANYSSAFDMTGQASHADDPDRAFAEQAGPNHYNCTGCDAALYNDVIDGSDPTASTEPMPAYRVEDAEGGAARPDESSLAPRRGSPPGSAAPTALLGSPVPLVVGPSQAATPSLPQTAAAQ